MTSIQPEASPEGGSLYAAREPIFPKSVRGFYRRLKWWIMGFTLTIYYVTPWIRWDRGPHAPDQAVLIDLANRRFYFFWIEIWPQEFYYIAGLLIMAGLGLFLFTSVLGRVWCGYACPQTVWVDLFQHVERWIDGDRNAQLRLFKQNWTLRKIWRRTLKWSIWLMIAIATGGAWIFYFADAPALLGEFVRGEAPFVAYGTVGVLTATTFVLGGFMREQVCIYMCPWPRIQAAMLDENSLTVTYKDWRGEPRGKHRKRAAAARVAAEVAEARIGGRAPVIAMPGASVRRETGNVATDRLGDCIDCNACVNVCPMGVDIRNGQQLGCITCALCIDACDDIMAKIGKPRGLIDYCTLADEQLERAGTPSLPVWRRVIRLRTVIYTVLWAGIGVAMLVLLFLRQPIDLSVTPDRNPVFVTLSDGSIRNNYTLKVQNMRAEPAHFRFSHHSEGGYFEASLQGEDGLDFEVPPDSARKLRLFLTAATWGEHSGRIPVRFWIENTDTHERAYYDTAFQGPEK